MKILNRVLYSSYPNNIDESIIEMCFYDRDGLGLLQTAKQERNTNLNSYQNTKAMKLLGNLKYDNDL